jgi:hypothetical protein
MADRSTYTPNSRVCSCTVRLFHSQKPGRMNKDSGRHRGSKGDRLHVRPIGLKAPRSSPSLSRPQ